MLLEKNDKMTENKRFKNVEEKLDWGTIQYFTYNDEKITDDEIKDLVNQLLEENEELKRKHYNELMEEGVKIERLREENEELKQQLSDKTKNNVKLNISFMKFKIQLIEVLQQNYNYAYNQRQKNLDKSIVARNYELLYQTIDNIAETMNVDIERFPKGDGV